MTRARIPEMMSRYCVSAVHTALTAVEGITRLELTIGAIQVEHDGRATTERLREALAVAGYTLADVETDSRSLPLHASPHD